MAVLGTGDANMAFQQLRMSMGDYQKLEVWKLACALSDRIDDLFLLLPRRVQMGLGDQLVRAAESIHMNIAEGCGLGTDSQLVRHIRIALGSANEVENGLLKLHRRGLIPEEYAHLLTDSTIVRRKLGAFLERLRKSLGD